jgi:hypothetical protein
MLVPALLIAETLALCFPDGALLASGIAPGVTVTVTVALPASLEDSFSLYLRIAKSPSTVKHIMTAIPRYRMRLRCGEGAGGVALLAAGTSVLLSCSSSSSDSCGVRRI